MSNENLLKSAVLTYIYGSPDLTYFYLKKLDEKNNSSISKLFEKVV